MHTATRMRHLLLYTVSAVLILSTSCVRVERAPGPRPVAAAGTAVLPGRKADGSVLLPNQWSLRPAGRQIQLRDFPANMAVHPGGRFVAIVHNGHSAHQIAIVDLRAGKAVSHVDVGQSFYGLEFSREGSRLFCSGAGTEVIHTFDFSDGRLGNHDEIRLHESHQRGVPAGLAVDAATSQLFAANVWGDRVTQVDLKGSNAPVDILLRANSGPLREITSTPAPDEDIAAAQKRSDTMLFDYDVADGFPYACRLDEKRGRLYVSLWGQAAVAVIDLSSRQVVTRWPTEAHPCEMALTRSGNFLFVANANNNTVTVIDTRSGRAIETIWAALFPDSPPGSTPNSLALTPDETMLFVANACNNTIAVFDVSVPGKSRSLGFIPSGWYPTSVRVTPEGRHLLVANGKGLQSKANPAGPVPGVNTSAHLTVEYIGRLFRGTLSVIDLPPRDRFERDMKKYTARAYRCAPLAARPTVAKRPPVGSPIPWRVGQPSPIKYCIYIVKENRTYDQVFGDMPEGNGDPKLCLFPEKVSPNHHKLAREFVLLDNFYVDSEVSADGHEWSMGAYATDFVEKMWPLMYGHNSPKKYGYPAEGNFEIASPAGGYLWDRAREAGVSYRSYGEFVNLHGPSLDPATVQVKGLEGHFDPGYRGFDLDYPDAKRADRLISELHRFEAEGKMPALQIVRLGNDHTHGSSRGKPTPAAYVADNDLALGRIIEAVSHSRFWPQTAVFVLEDDAQNGPDHVDAHRSPALIVSPWTKRHVIDSSMYSTCSMLRTMELILGLKPMSQFDAAARPMYNCFGSTPDLRPYTVAPARVNLEERNSVFGWGADIEMDFSKEDAADDLVLNEMIWRAVRGADHPMPPPVRAGFIRPQSAIDDD